MADRSTERSYWESSHCAGSSDTCSGAAGYLEKNSRFSAGRSEEAGTSRNGKQWVRDCGYTKLNNPGCEQPGATVT